MRVVIQRVSEASVTIDGIEISSIASGLLVLLGIEPGDIDEDVIWLAQKICNMRIFSDANDIMNLSLLDVKGELLLVSQFTLHASTKKGNRPSYIGAARPDIAIPLYQKMILALQQQLGKAISTGVFGADMKVKIINDGPVTITIDSKRKE